MSVDKATEMKSYEIDKNKRRHRTDDTVVAKVVAIGGEDTSQHTKMEGTDESAGKPTELILQGNCHLISSTTSSLADTPGDSGVLCLDSEASEATSQALMSHSLIGTEELTCDSVYDAPPSCSQDMIKSTTSSLMTRSDLDSQNMVAADDTVPELVVETHKKPNAYENLPDVVLKALESEKVSIDDSKIPALRTNEPKKSSSEDIVYRRRCRKKSQSGPSSQKKRVSFHEDILNNTKTDNIHIERGFISYGPDSSYCDRFRQKNNITTDRFSWCASGDNRTPKFAADVAQQTMSDILTYGDSVTDRTGIFEYSPTCERKSENIENSNQDKDNNNDSRPSGKLYGCDSNSSDSNFSCDSETSSSESSSSHSNKTETTLLHRKCDKAQKSYSCDGFENNGHVAFLRKTYFSEADIDQSTDRMKKPLEVTQSTVKSVLKKKRYITTNIVEERKQNNKVLNLLDANNIIDSLKNFYKTFNFMPEKGLVESSVDLNNVVEALPCDVNQNKGLSKSLDSGFHVDDEEDFVEINLNGQNLETSATNKTAPNKNTIAGDRTPNEGSPRHKLTLNMKTPSDKKTTKNESLPPLSKYVVNCESTVYEHKGVSYSYVHDTFQTAFDAPKESFVPLPDTTPVKELTASTSKSELSTSKSELSIKSESNSISQTSRVMDVETSSKGSTPKRQFNKNVQDETEQKNGIPKHLSSPKKQNVNRYSRKSASTVQKLNEEAPPQVNSDNCSNTDNSTLKGAEDFNEDFFDSPANQKLQSNKSALLNRYLKSVCQRKDLELKIKNNKFFQTKLRLEKHFPSILFPFKEVSETFHISAERMSRLIDKELIENKRLSVRLLTADEPSYFDSFEDNVAIECSEKLRLQIFSYPNETLNRMMKVKSPFNMDGSWTPLLVFITDYALYVAGVKQGGTEYEILCRLPHNELDAIAVGPEAQYIQIIDIAGNIACSVVTGESSLGARLASSLEWSARTSPLRILRPPAMIPLTFRELAAAVARQRREERIPQILFYGQVCSGDAGDRLIEAPGAFAPPLEGYLMCKTDKSRRFEPCYFLLRAGVLYWGPHTPDGTSPLPHNISLRSVVGVRRHVDWTRRPHCFEIALVDNTRLLLAAPDEPNASSWLQSLLLHAAQALEEKDGAKKVDSRAGGPPPACTVLVTHTEVISLRNTLDMSFIRGAAAYLKDRGSEALLKEYIAEMRTDIEILACGSIKNLTAFKIPDTDENWCCLEWSVCEARERGAGLALVLSSSNELERFIAAVERAFCALTCEPFPLSVVDSTKSACSAAHTKYEAAWAHMLPSHQ